MINYNRACQPCQQESPWRLHLINTAYMDRTTNTLSQLTGYRHSWTLSRTSFIFSNASCADTLAERPWLKCDSFWGDSQRWFCIWRHYMKCFWDSVPLMYANVAQQMIIHFAFVFFSHFTSWMTSVNLHTCHFHSYCILLPVFLN